MNDYDYRPQLASNTDLRDIVRRMLTAEGYEFNEYASLETTASTLSLGSPTSRSTLSSLSRRRGRI